MSSSGLSPLHPPAARPPALLQAAGLSCQRGGRRLFEQLDLTLAAGDIVWLRGRNGCGKSSLLRVLAGLRPADSGRVQLRAALRFVGHSNALKDELSLLEGLRFQARWQGLPAEDAVLMEALRRFELDRLARRRYGQLSQGQRRRAGLAALALPQAGACWLLDEPFDALDDASIEGLLALMRNHAAGGGALLFTSHQALPALAARTLWLDGGPA